MENKNININIKDNAQKTAKNVDKMNESFYQTKKAYDAVLKSGKPYQQQLKDIDKIVKETPLNVRDMNKQIQAYQSIALSAGRETPIGREALEKASQLRDKYVDIQNETKRLADDHRTLNGVMELASIGVAGYGAVQSAMALTGTENEALQKSLQKLMAAQTLMNSINQIAKALEKESAAMLLLKDTRLKALTLSQTIYTAVTGKATKATKLFKIALASTGIGLLVVAVGALIANFDKILSVMTPVVDAFKSFGDAIGLTNFALDEQSEKQAAILQKIKDTNAARKEEINLQQRYNADAIKNLELDKSEAKTAEDKIAINNELLKLKLDNIQKEQDKFLGDQKVKLAANEKLESDLYNQYVKYNKKRFGREEAKAQDYFNRYADQKRINDEFDKQINEGNFQRFTEFDTQRRELEQQFAKDNDDIRSQDVEKDKAANQEKLNNYKTYQKNRLNASRKIEDIENSLMEKGLEKELEINKTKFERLRQDLITNTNLTRTEKQALEDLYNQQELKAEQTINKKFSDIEKAKKDKEKAEKEKGRNEDLAKRKAQNDLRISLMKDEEAKEIILLKQKFAKKLQLATGNHALTKQVEEQQNLEIKAIEDKFRLEREAKDKESSDKEIAQAQAVADAKMAIQDAQFSNAQAAIGLVKELAGDNKKLQGAALIAENAVGVAKIIINTQAANAAAKLKYAALPGGIALAAGEVAANNISAGIGIASAATATAKGLSALKTGGSPIKGGNLPSGAAGGGTPVQAPNFNIVGENNVNQLAELQQQPTKAFVVSSEVTSAQALDRKVEDFATL